MKVHAVGLEPDRPLHPVGHGRHAAGVSLHHRLRPGGHGRAGRDRAARGSRSAIASGARTRDCSAARASRRSTRPSMKPGSTRRPPCSRTPRPRRWPWSGSRPTSACSNSASSRRARRSTSRAAAAESARWSCRWPRRPVRGVATAAGSPERLDLCRRLGADLALNYKTDDIPAELREFAPEGVDVWYETQREPNLEVSIPSAPQARPDDPDRRPHGQAGLPLGAFYPRNCAIFGFAMFNASADEQRRCADDIDPLDRGRGLQATGRPDVPLVGRRRRRAVPRRKDLEGRGLAHRKSRDHHRIETFSRHHESAHDDRRLDDGRVFCPAAGTSPRSTPAARIRPRRSASGRPWWHPRFEPVACDSVADFDVDDGPRDRPGDQAAPRPRPARRPDLAGRPDGHVPLGGLFPQGMGRRLRPRPRLQHGRMERPRRRDPACRASRRVSERDGGGVLRAAGHADRARGATAGSPRPIGCPTTPSGSAS